MVRTLKITMMLALVVGAAGCLQRHRARQAQTAPCPPPPGRVVLPPPPGAVGPGYPSTLPPPPSPVGGGLPPGAVFTPPAGARIVPPADPVPGISPIPVTPPATPPPPAPVGPARVDYRWTPAPGAHTAEPKSFDPAPKGPTRVLLFPPEVTEEPPLEDRKETSKAVPRRGVPSLPVGIPGFAAARDNVATGLRPSLDEGLDWLAANGYKTVLHIHQPSEPDGADRKQVEKRGMHYVSLPVNPKNLTKETTDKFLNIVKDANGHPLFVYDRDGSLAGPLWYLYFHAVEELPEDAARLRAGPLGLRETGEMWEAVRKLAP